MSRRERISRVGLTLCLLVPLGLMNQSPVRAWSNVSSGPNSYGTHDWILDQAVRALKRRNNTANWVKLDVALWATDDPDTQDGIDHSGFHSDRNRALTE